MNNPQNLPLDGVSLFLQAWLSRRMIDPGVGADLVRTYGNLTATRLFRLGKFQVELLSVLPNSEIPDHIHPHMDSYEVFVGGDITFRADGAVFTPTAAGQYIRIKPNCSHGGTFGPAGGVFLSVQEWEGEPASAGQDWEFADPAETAQVKAAA